MSTIRATGLLAGCLLAGPAAWAMGGPDGVLLHCSKGPGGNDVTLQWTGGVTPFGIFRASSPVDVAAPANHLGGTSGSSWIDTPPAGSLFFYLVQGECDFNPPELCDGLDNDCDPATADGSDDPQVGTICDGADSDFCLEGTRSCAGGSLACSDLTVGTLDVCNGLDDDCDATSVDGGEDPQVGATCDGTDGDACMEGTAFCGGGSIGCTDLTSTTNEVCGGNGVDEDCDGATDEGFNRNDNPSCAAAVVSLGTISGDTGSGQVVRSRFDEEFYRIRIVEDSGSLLYVSASVQLYSPPGTDFDLYVYCGLCGGGTAGSSTAGGLEGHYDTVNVRSNDDIFADDSFDITIEVRHWQTNHCASWTLTVFGNTAVGTETCN